jgi:hypothetical protein
MTAIANLVLNDGQATPVARTFNPTVAALNRAVWQDRSSGILTGMPTVILTSRLPGVIPITGKDAKGSSDMFKVMASIKIPVMEVVSNSTYSGLAPAPQIAYTLSAKLEFMIPARCTLQNRKDIQAFAANLLANSQFTTLLTNFEAPY